MQDDAGLVEVIARELCITDGFDPEEITVLIAGREGGRPTWEAFEIPARAALAAIEAAGWVVVARVTAEELETWARILPHPQAGDSDLRYLHSLAIMRSLAAAPKG